MDGFLTQEQTPFTAPNVLLEVCTFPFLYLYIMFSDINHIITITKKVILHFYHVKQSKLCISLHFTSSLWTQLINATRFRTFDSVLSGILDGIPVPQSSLSPFQNSSNSNKNTSNKYSNTNNNNSPYYNQTHNQNQNTNVEDSNTINRSILLDDVKKKLSQWYVQQHGVHTDGNVHEMATIIQVGIMQFFIFYCQH